MIPSLGCKIYLAISEWNYNELSAKYFSKRPNDRLKRQYNTPQYSLDWPHYKQLKKEIPYS
jgi:hypothetical protein